MNDGDLLLKEIDEKAYLMALTEAGIERGYAHIGLMLLEVAEMQYWRVRHDSFREYLKVVAAKAKRSPGQLQQYFLTVRDLMDTFTPAEMETIGITKATKLRQAKDYALVLPQTLKTAALDPKISSKELKKLISETLKMPEDDGDWMDLGFEFYVTPEERATIEDAIRAAEHCDPVTKKTVAESVQKKDVVLKWAMEFLGAHAGEIPQ